MFVSKQLRVLTMVSAYADDGYILNVVLEAFGLIGSIFLSHIVRK